MDRYAKGGEREDGHSERYKEASNEEGSVIKDEPADVETEGDGKDQIEFRGKHIGFEVEVTIAAHSTDCRHTEEKPGSHPYVNSIPNIESPVCR